jgi:ubiquinone/menaquinone biosynthesis C-methylase UbiE
MFTRLTGLSHRVEFRQGSALQLPFADGAFDLAWSQNVAMNIADRNRYYGEMHRVLKAGGRLAIQDVAQGPAGEPHYPLMWASSPAMSFLRTPDDTRLMLEQSVLRYWYGRTTPQRHTFGRRAELHREDAEFLGQHD